MTAVFAALMVQIAMGAFDNLWHHEWRLRLPARPSARRELALHATREAIYAVVFAGIAWARWEGAWAFVLAGLLAVEIAVTLWDFVVEDRMRKLPPLERVTHTLLAINLGVLLALWAPEIADWAAAPTGFGAADYGLVSWFLTAAAVGVGAWAVRDLLAVWRLKVPEWQRHPLRAGRSDTPRTVLVTGATGFIGRALVRALVERGDRVVALSRDPERAADWFGPHVEVCGDLARLEASRQIDAVVNLAGQSLVSGPWTRARRRLFLDSRLAVTQAVLDLIARLHRTPEVLVTGSAIGFYGERGSDRLLECEPPQPMFLSQLCRRWETLARRAEGRGVRVCRLRTGLVLGAEGGSLPPLALATRLGLGAVLGDGTQYQSWIHRDDLVRLILFAIDTPVLAGAVNGVAPFPATQREFMATLGRTLNRRIRLRVPARALRMGLGGLADLFLVSQRVQPGAALAAGFRFGFAHLDEALGNLLLRSQAPATAVFVNTQCPICSREMSAYDGRARAAGCDIDFRPIGADSEGMRVYGLGDGELRRRLFVLDRDGTPCGGLDALIAIWRTLPCYRWLAAVAGLPGAYGLLSAFYDGVVAPSVVAFNERRARRLLRVRQGRTP